jgi:CubicO group peptidase (beta-lactamase class C family)
MLLKGGVHEGRRLLSADSVRGLTKDQLTRYGWIGGFGTSWVNDPGRDMVAIVMTQSSDFLFSGGLEAFWRGVYVAVE